MTVNSAVKIDEVPGKGNERVGFDRPTKPARRFGPVGVTRYTPDVALNRLQETQTQYYRGQEERESVA